MISVSDGWAFTNNIDINQHRSLEERLSAARLLVQQEPLCPVVVDEMKDVAAIKYGAVPERLYVLQAGKVIYKVRSACALPSPTLIPVLFLYTVLDLKIGGLPNSVTVQIYFTPPSLFLSLNHVIRGYTSSMGVKVLQCA